MLGVFVKPEVRETLESLRSTYECLPSDQLSKLEWKELEPVEVDGETLTPAVWAYKSDSSWMMIVQLSSPKNFIGVYKQYALGAFIGEDGSIEHVPEETLWKEGIV